MEAKTKKIIVISAITLGSIIVITMASKRIHDAIIKRRSDKDKPKDEDKPFDPKTQVKTVMLGSQGYLNIRNSPKVPSIDYWGVLTSAIGMPTAQNDNMIGKATSNPVGVVGTEQKGADGYMWYYITLKKPIGKYKHGWVREDALTISVTNK